MENILKFVKFVNEMYNGQDYDYTNPNLFYSIIVKKNYPLEKAKKELPKDVLIKDIKDNNIFIQIINKGTGSTYIKSKLTQLKCLNFIESIKPENCIKNENINK